MMNNSVDFASQAQPEYANVNDTFYPTFHLAPPAGWMNDPNGLIYHQGRYHAFYQHYPYEPKWGPMHWGHATSEDMIRWQHQPIALFPGGENEPDRDGCFSGCAVNDDGVLSLIYTGHVVLPSSPEEGEKLRQVQCLAISHDGLHFEKQGAILLPPPGIMHFRDPKVWRENGVWWMVVGARNEQDQGQVLLYRGETLREWALDRVLAESDGELGYMWECPDFFPLGDEWLLMFSPQGVSSNGYRYRNLFQSGCLRGHWRPGDDFDITEPFAELDLGHDFYAPQSFLAADGRRIVLGWMDMWESPMPSQRDHWAGCMTLPRELSLEDGQLRVRPVREVESLRRDGQVIAPQWIDSQSLALTAHGDARELMLRWDLNDSTAERFGLTLGDGLRLFADTQSGRLVLERHYPEYGLSGYRSAPLPAQSVLSLRIFIDRSSIEVFVGEGERCLSSRIYPQPDRRELQLFADHGRAHLAGGDSWSLLRA